MNCESAQEYLALAIDGAEGLPEEVRSHADACPECRTLYDELRLTAQWCGELGALEPSPQAAWGLAERVSVRTKALQARREWRAKLPMIGGLTAAAAVLMLALSIPLATQWAETGGAPQSAGGQLAAIGTAAPMAQPSNRLYHASGETVQKESESQAMTGTEAAPQAAADMASVGSAARKEASSATQPETPAGGSVADGQAQNGAQADAAGDGSVAGDMVMTLPEVMTSNIDQNAKRIITGNLTIETNKYDADIEQLNAALTQLNGFIARQQVSDNGGEATGFGRNANVTARVPQQSFDALVQRMNSLGTPGWEVRYTTDMSDMTAEYQDAQSLLAAYEKEMEQLSGYMTKAAELDDVLALGTRMAVLQNQIDQQQGQLRMLDAQSAYANVNLNLSERTTPTLQSSDPNFGDRLRGAWVDTLSGIREFGAGALVFLVSSIPVIALLAIPVGIALGIIGLVRRRKRRRMSKEGGAQS